MEVKENNIASICIIIELFIMIALLIIPAIVEVRSRHKERILKVTESKIIESAKRCYAEQKCLNTNITLQELYNNHYLEEIDNPVSKNKYNANSYVIVEEENFEFVEVS